MELFTPLSTTNFTETLSLQIPLSITNNTQAYTCLCINEILHKLGIITENNYAVIYAMITDSDIFTEF